MTNTTNPTPRMSAAKAARKFKLGKIPTPAAIVKYLDERVIGQDEAKRTLAVAVYNHYKRVLSNTSGLGNDGEWEDVELEKSNVIMLGSTGSGKTYLIKNIAKMLGVPCHIHDCSKLTCAGYAGEDVEAVLVGLLNKADMDMDRAEMGIVCLDEVDKIAKRPDAYERKDVGGEAVQQGLLKIVEGCELEVMTHAGRRHPNDPTRKMDTSNILFIAMGAFSGLEDLVEKRTTKKVGIGFARKEAAAVGEEKGCHLEEVRTEDLRAYGMIPEFLGRFPVITSTRPLRREDLVRIISEPKNSILRQYQKLAHIDGKELVFEQDALELIADAALANETGARGIRGIMETVLKQTMFDLPTTRKKRIVVTREYAEQALGITAPSKPKASSAA